MKDATQFHIRPARPEEAGLFYTPHPEEDKRLGTVGHVRMDFGRSGNEFWHTWWPRGPEELNSPAFKAELQEVVDTLRESVLKNRFAMERFCYEHGGKIDGGWTQNYRRVVWTQHDEKRAVWRCCSRLDYGKKCCEHSPALDEAPLQQAILDAVNASMSDHGTLSARLMSAMEQELAPIPGESMSLGDIDRAMEELGKQFDKLLGEAANADDAETYVERFQSLSEGMEDLKRRKASILQIRQEQDAVSRRLQASAAALDAVSAQITEWDENTVYQLLEKVTVMDGFKIRVTFRNGQEIEQSIVQPKRRKRI